MWRIAALIAFVLSNPTGRLNLLADLLSDRGANISRLSPTDITRAFPIGADVEVFVLEVDLSGRRIRLSAKE